MSIDKMVMAKNILGKISSKDHTAKEAVFNAQDVLVFTPEMCSELKERALQAERRRYRLCMHKSHNDLTQEMVIVACEDTFMPPHRHPKGKTESYHLIEGCMCVYLFNDDGAVIDKFDLGDPSYGLPVLYRLSSNYWHMPVVKSKWLIYHECFTGPFDKDHDVEYPTWAPNEMNKQEIANFYARILKS